MTAELEKRLRKLAVEFRVAIEECRHKISFCTFESHSVLPCGDVSDFLGRYLLERGFNPIDYISATRTGSDGFPISHAWLEVNGVTVDITADNFDDAPEGVIVAVESPWHASFEEVQRRAPGSSLPVHSMRSDYEDTYRLIVKQVFD